MYSTNSSVFSVNRQARAICAQNASKERTRFITGSCSLHQENEIYVLEYNEDSNQIDTVGLYSHNERELWSVDSSHSDPSLLVTCGYNQKDTNFTISLWEMPNQTELDVEDVRSRAFREEALPMTEKVQFQETDNSFQGISWHKKKDSVLLTSPTSVSQWSITESGVKVNSQICCCS